MNGLPRLQPQFKGNTKPLRFYEESRPNVVAGCDDGNVHVWDLSTSFSDQFGLTDGHVLDVACYHDAVGEVKILAAASDGNLVVISDSMGKAVRTIPAHHDMISGISVSSNGRLVASKSSRDGTVRLFQTGTWNEVKKLSEEGDSRLNRWHSGLAFHPAMPILATLGVGDRSVRIWDVSRFNAIG